MIDTSLLLVALSVMLLMAFEIHSLTGFSATAFAPSTSRTSTMAFGRATVRSPSAAP